MNLTELIKDYQTLVGTLTGSFLAIISSILLWSLKEWHDHRKKIKDAKKEIENIFLMATRESEDAMKDLAGYIKAVRSIKENAKEIDILVPPRFNRIYINEERLFTLKKDLNFIISQQIDIAVSSAKKFNGYLDQFESSPDTILATTLKMLQAGLISKERAIESYNFDKKVNLNNMESNLKGSMLRVQKHLLRPIIVQSPKYRRISDGVNIDSELDMEADIVRAAMKKYLE